MKHRAALSSGSGEEMKQRDGNANSQLYLQLIPSLAHTDKHMHTRTHTYTHMHTHMRMCMM